LTIRPRECNPRPRGGPISQPRAIPRRKPSARARAKEHRQASAERIGGSAASSKCRRTARGSAIIYIFFQPSFFSIPFFFPPIDVTALLFSFRLTFRRGGPPGGGREEKCSLRTRLIGTSTRATTTDVCYSAYNASRARLDRSAQKVTERVAHCRRDGGRRAGVDTRWNKRRDSDGPRGKEGSRDEEERRGEEAERREGDRARNVRFRPCNTLARTRARARARERIAAPPSSPRGRRCSCRLRSVGAVLMPNVFVPMHQALLSRSRALASASWPAACPILLVPARRRATFDPTRSPRVSASLLSSASLDAPRCSTLAETRARADAHRAKVSGRTRAERRVTPRHRSVQRFPTSAPPPPIPLPTSNLPPPPPRSPPHRPRHGTAAPHGLRAFLMLNVAFCLCGCMGDSGREAVARPALFFKC